MTSFIPVYEPLLGEEEWQNVRSCLESTWISSRGPFIDEFEQSFAAAIGTPHAVAVCNGTAALHLALLGVGVGAGDQVAVTTFTYIASVNAIRYVGAEPVFIDSDPETLQISVTDFAAKAARHRLRAVVVPHLYGQAADMESLVPIARAHDVRIVEDCAEAFGTRIGSRHVGTYGSVSTFSFFGNKTITTGEGGMVCSDDDDVMAAVRKLRGQGLVAGREYWHDELGFNYRMTNICAAIGVAQLARSDDLLQRKRRIASHYRDAMHGVPVSFHDETVGTTHAFWMCSILTRTAIERDRLREHLRTRGVDTRPFFNLVHRMPMYERWDLGPYPGADTCSCRGLNLPSSPGLPIGDQLRVADAVREFYGVEMLRESIA